MVGTVICSIESLLAAQENRARILGMNSQGAHMAFDEHAVAGANKRLAPIQAAEQSFADGADVESMRTHHGFFSCWQGSWLRLSQPSGSSASSATRAGKPSLIRNVKAQRWQMSRSSSSVKRWLGSIGQRRISSSSELIMNDLVKVLMLPLDFRSEF